MSPLSKMNPSEHSGCVIWFTGLSGAGKTTIAQAVQSKLAEQGILHELIDGDIVREFVSNTGFSPEDRERHLKYMGLVAHLLEKNGVVVLAAFALNVVVNRNWSGGIP